jgi:hypothetical protein
VILVIGAALALLFAAVLLMPTRARGWIWIAVIIVAVVPWYDFQSHSHWRRVGWVPFLSPPVRLRDILINTAMYVPFGLFFFTHDRANRLRTFLIVVAALTLSMTTEASQSYSHSRFPSATDVVANTSGAALGCAIAAGRRRRGQLSADNTVREV